MQNYKSPGENVTITAPAAITAGDGIQIGSLFGVAQATVASGVDVVLARRGIYTLPKLSAQAWTVGALIYWDAAAKQCTTVVATNKPIGVAMAVAANPSSFGDVLLDGAAR